MKPIPRQLLVVVAAALAVAAYATCSACGKGTAPGANAAPGAADSAAADARGAEPTTNRRSAPPDAGPAALRDVAMWSTAQEGLPEDLAALATQEGAAGLVEATAEPELRATALRAMAFARGWSHVPHLARTVGGPNEAEARIALDSLLELAARPRHSEDVEDADELREGCEKLGALARETTRARELRIATIKALRMMPCPKQEIPTDLDAR